MLANLQTVHTRAGRAGGFVEFGDRDARRALVLLHGFPLGIRMWEPQRAAFPDWRVVVPVYPGFDGTEPLPPSPSIDDYAAHVLAILDRLGVERAAFLGLSMGGYVALGIRRLAPQRMSALVLADTRSAPDSEQGKAARLAMLERLERLGPPAVADDMMPKFIGRTSLTTRPDLVATVRAMIESQSRPAIAGALTAIMNRPDSTPLLGAIDIPTLVMVGEEDTLTPPDESERMQAAIPGASLVRIPRVGHMSNMEAADAFNAAVAEHLRRVQD